MTINFIGHGLSSSKDNITVGKYLKASFQDNKFSKFLGFSAYSTTGGIKNLIPALKIAKLHFEEIKFFIGIDDKITTKEVFQIFLDLGIDSFVFHTQSEVIFHPKIYIFEGKRKNRIILGSSNLTLNGLFNQNIEASVVVDFGVSDIAGRKFLNQIKDYFQSVINVETENVKKIDCESLETFVNQGFIKINSSKKEKPKDEAVVNDDNSLFPELNKAFLSQNDVSEVSISERKTPNSTGKEINKDRNYLSPQYFNSWHSHFDALKNFKQQFGHTVLPSEYEDEVLVEWSRKQKYLYNENIIPEEHKNLLNSIDFYWRNAGDWNSERIWDENYEKFKKYYQKHKTFTVSRKFDKSLANWIVTTRHEKKLLQDYQIKKMDDLNPTWKLSSKEINDNLWYEKLLQLEKYKTEHGHCNVPQTHENLGRWLNDQRIDKKREKINPERLELLESIGVVWDMVEYKFQQDIERLIKYKKRFGNFDVPLDFKEDKQLAIFVFGLKNRGTTPEKKQKLDELGFNWEKHYSKSVNFKSGYITKEWAEQVVKIKNLYSKGVDVNNISADSSDLKKIKAWIVRQQKRYRTEELKPEQIRQLLDAGIKLEKVSRQDQRWECFYDLLISFKQENGHCRVTDKYDEEFRNWVCTQRTSYRDKIIDPYKIGKLNELDFEWNIGKSNRIKVSNFAV